MYIVYCIYIYNKHTIYNMLLTLKTVYSESQLTFHYVRSLSHCVKNRVGDYVNEIFDPKGISSVRLSKQLQRIY